MITIETALIAAKDGGGAHAYRRYAMACVVLGYCSFWAAFCWSRRNDALAHKTD